MRGRSLLLLDYSKLERETLEIWIKLIKSRAKSAKECPELNHAQFNICIMENQIKVDPDLSVTLFWMLITTYDRKKQIKKSATVLTPPSINDDYNNNHLLKFPIINENNNKNNNNNNNELKEEKELNEENKDIAGQIMKERAKKNKKAKITPKHLKYVIKSIEKLVSNHEDCDDNVSTTSRVSSYIGLHFPSTPIIPTHFMIRANVPQIS